MLELKIVLENEDEISLLTEISLANKLSSLAYATNIVRGWIQAQLRGKYMEQIQKASPEVLKELTGVSYTGISTKVTEIKTAIAKEGIK